MGGGGRPSAPPPQPVPPPPAPIDYDKMANASIRVAQAQSAAEEAAIRRLYPEYINMQFGTANQLANNLNNQYLGTARDVISNELNAASRSSALEDAIQRRSANQFASGPTLADRQILGQSMMAMGQRADQVGGPSNIREIASQDVGEGTLGNALMQQAVARAQSGGRLSSEASRDATQAARAGMAARGMATGSAGLAAEMLNRDRFARARQAEDNAFASAVQGQDVQRQFSNQEARMRAAMANQQRDQSLGEMSMRAQMANQAANQNQLAQNREFMLVGRDAFNAAEDRRMNMALGANNMDLARRQRRIGLSGMFMETDPYRQALGPAFGLGGDTLRTSQGQVSNIFNNSLAQSGNVMTFNTNMAASNRNAILNNNAAMQAAAMQAGAQQNAGMMGMFGGIGGGIASGAGMAIAGASF